MENMEILLDIIKVVGGIVFLLVLITLAKTIVRGTFSFLINSTFSLINTIFFLITSGIVGSFNYVNNFFRTKRRLKAIEEGDIEKEVKNMTYEEKVKYGDDYIRRMEVEEQNSQQSINKNNNNKFRTMFE